MPFTWNSFCAFTFSSICTYCSRDVVQRHTLYCKANNEPSPSWHADRFSLPPLSHHWLFLVSVFLPLHFLSFCIAFHPNSLTLTLKWIGRHHRQTRARWWEMELKCYGVEFKGGSRGEEGWETENSGWGRWGGGEETRPRIINSRRKEAKETGG